MTQAQTMQQQDAYPTNEQNGRKTQQDKEEQEHRVLRAGRSSTTRNVAEAIVIKDENVFFLTQRDSEVPLEGDHGLGLYYHDCRFLKGYALRIAGTHANQLVWTATAGYKAVFELSNPDIRMANGKLCPKEEIGIKWERTIDSAQNTLYDAITFVNYGLQVVEFPISLTFQSEFESIMTVRGATPEKRGTLHPPAWNDDVLIFAYDGADGLYRRLYITFSEPVARKEETAAHFQVRLAPRERQEIHVSLCIAESPDPAEVQPKPHAGLDLKGINAELKRVSDAWLEKHTQIAGDSLVVSRVLDRSLRDLHVLKTSLDHQEFFAAGLPWFGTLFGRDSLITSIQTLAFNPEIAEQTLLVLAHYQGNKEDEWRDEQPGKIMHELRVDEMAHLNEIPYTPYYGTIDATPLFLILVSRHAAWTGTLKLFHELKGNIERALEWIAKYGNAMGNGYLAYQRKSSKGLANQGWKDSGDAIVNADGSLAEPPIALVEVQGYVYMAKTGLAELYDRAGQPAAAAQLRKEAQDLRERFNQDFWMEDEGCYSLALEKGGKQCAVVSSNPGQALWTAIADEDKASRTMQRLLADDMFNGWGIQTLSQKEQRYNPIGYHLGTVWPHDNSIIAAGFRRYGGVDGVHRIFCGIIEAAMRFEDARLPEVFAGFPRENYGVPVHYPVACHPQAWAAGSVPFLIESMLGLVPEAFEHRLRLVQPILPEFVHHLEIRGLRVGEAQVDIRLERTMKGVGVMVLNKEGELDVVVEPGA